MENSNMVDSEICLIRNLNLMVSQRYSEAPLKCCRKSVKADVMCFIKAQRNILKVPLLFSSIWQTDCVELAYCFTPLQSDVFKKRPGMCEVWKLLFAKLDQLSMDLRKNMQLNTDLHTDSVGHMTFSVGISKQSLLGVSVGSWHGNYCLHSCSP